MTKHPFINAFVAGLYIVIIAAVMDFGTKIMPHPPRPTVFAPIAVISIFTLSAAVMGYIFCYQPLQLYFDGKKKTAVRLFLQTVAIFAIITILTLALLFSGF